MVTSISNPCGDWSSLTLVCTRAHDGISPLTFNEGKHQLKFSLLKLYQPIQCWLSKTCSLNTYGYKWYCTMAINDTESPLLADYQFNSSPPSAAYMRQWTGSSLIQVMACRLFGAKSLPEAMLVYCQLDSWDIFQWNMNRNSIIYIQENAIENVVCQNGSHFVKGGWVKYPANALEIPHGTLTTASSVKHAQVSNLQTKWFIELSIRVCIYCNSLLIYFAFFTVSQINLMYAVYLITVCYPWRLFKKVAM